MEDFTFDETLEAAMIFAEIIAKAYADRNGDMVDFFATFVGMVVQEDREIGLRCLECADQWFADSSSDPRCDVQNASCRPFAAAWRLDIAGIERRSGFAIRP